MMVLPGTSVGAAMFAMVVAIIVWLNRDRMSRSERATWRTIAASGAALSVAVMTLLVFMDLRILVF